MSSLAETLRRLSALGQPDPAARHSAAGGAILTPLGDFGANPGDLDGFCFLPPDLPPASPLVVVLHGCTQTAQAYERGAGWTMLARQHGFAVLYPQQRRANNGNLCFNWFETADTARLGGEAESIAQMIGHLVARHGLDPARIYVNGLSAGGAMTSVMLARYPDLFAAGAVIAGLPFGVAQSVSQALSRMGGTRLPSGETLAARVRKGMSHRGPWPRVSVWHGLADHVVAPANAQAVIGQWLALHGVADVAPVASMVDGHDHLAWHDGDGRMLVESHSIAGLGHGTPIASREPGAIGEQGPHMLEAGTSSTRRIAQFWGLVPAGPARSSERSTPQPPPRSNPGPIDVQAVIDLALRRAGLKR